MKYDDASWHYGADNFPKELPQEAGGTHIAMFVAWAFLSDLAGELRVEDSPESLEQLRNRSVTPNNFFFHWCDGKFTDEDLNELGNQFAQSYFDFEKGHYLKDYESILGRDVPDLYFVADTWDNFDRLKQVLDRRYKEWLATN